MLNLIWPVFIIISFSYAIFSGNVEILNKSIFESVEDAVKLGITMLGTMCLWTGIINIASNTNNALLYSYDEENETLNDVDKIVRGSEVTSNDKIKVIKRVGVGYENFEFFRLIILYVLKSKDSKKAPSSKNKK